MSTANIAIAGGSLGGLTAALLLRDLGHDVTVYERSAVELEQRGAGIGFLPDSSRYLVERVGLSLDDISTSTDVIRYFDRRGGVTNETRHRYHFSSWNTVYRHLLFGFGQQGCIGDVVLGAVGVVLAAREQTHELDLLHEHPTLALGQVAAGDGVEGRHNLAHRSLALWLVVR